jgi:hypothetical protein
MTVLLARFWRHGTADVIRRFNDAFQQHDLSDSLVVADIA